MDKKDERLIPELEDVKEVLSEGEERVEHIRKTVGLFLGPLIFFAIYFSSTPSLSPQAHVLAAIIGFVITWWITEPIPIPATSILAAVLIVVLNVAPAAKALAAFADPTIFLFLGSFILAEAMMVHRLDRRFAFGILALPWVGNSTARILLVYGFIACFISMWISNTAATAMMFPIGLGIVYAMADMIAEKTGKKVNPTQLRFGTGMMLMVAYSASVGGIGTPVGTPPNLIGIAMIEKLVKVKISFFEWMLFAVPLMLVMFAILFVLMYFMHKPEMSRIEGGQELVKRELAKLGKWTAGQKNTLFCFGLAVVLWIIPGFLSTVYGSSSVIAKLYNSRMPEAVGALVAALFLFILPTDWKKREFTISWKQATNIDWGTLFLFGGGLTMGNLMFETKLAEAVGKGMLGISGASSLWGITFAAIVIAILVSEATSNTASANMVVPVMISLAMAAGVNPIPPALGATLGASYGFMLPVSTPPNAIVYGSGMIPITKMIRAGIVFDIFGAICIWVGLRLLLPLLGWA